MRSSGRQRATYLVGRVWNTLVVLVTVATALGSGWAMTGVWGVRQIEHRVLGEVEERLDASDRLSFDPTDSGKQWPPSYSGDWHFVGNAHSPYPFVVAVDVAVKSGPFGSGQREYFFWLFGATFHLSTKLFWNSG